MNVLQIASLISLCRQKHAIDVVPRKDVAMGTPERDMKPRKHAQYVRERASFAHGKRNRRNGVQSDERGHNLPPTSAQGLPVLPEEVAAVVVVLVDLDRRKEDWMKKKGISGDDAAVVVKETVSSEKPMQ